MTVYITEKTKTIYAEVFGRDGNPVKKGPKAVRMVVRDTYAAQIQSFAQCVAEHGLYKVQRFDWPTWLDKMPATTDVGVDVKKSPYKTTVETLNVNAEEFWYEAYIEGTDIMLISERVPIANLDY